jgi:hypothetical protein
VLLRLKAKQSKLVPRRMPCRKYIRWLARTFRSNQLANEGSSQKTIQKQQSFRKEPKNKTTG